jgi:hypothetical protein
LEHLAYGNRENYVTTRQEWARDQSTFLYNLRRIDGWIVLLLYFNVLWAAIFLKWKELPRFIRRVFIIVPLSLVSFLYLGRIVEGRLYLPILPLFLPAGLMMLESSVASRSVPPNGEPNQG